MAKKGKFVFLIILGSLLALIAAAGVIGRSVLLRRVRDEVRSTFEFSRMSLSFLPPSLVLDDVKSKPGGPFFAAKRVSVTAGLLSLLSKSRPVSVFIDRPVLRITQEDIRRLKSRPKGRSLPFSLDRALVREAEVTVDTGGALFHCKKGSGIYRSHGLGFSLEAIVPDNVLTLLPSRHQYHGRLRLLIDSDGGRLHFRRLSVEGPSLILKAKGALNNLSDPDLDFSVVFEGETSLPMDIFHVPFQWTGKTRGEGTVKRARKSLLIDTSLSSQDLAMTGIPLGEVLGRFRLQDGRGDVDLTVLKRPEPRSYVKVLFGDGLVRGLVTGVTLDPVMKEIALAWPVRSPAWGEFRVEDGHLHVQAELRDDLAAGVVGDRFPFQGTATVDWDGAAHVTFESKKLTSSFGRMDLTGTVNIGHDLDLTISGEVSDAAQARRFTELFLKTRFGLPETGGRGSGEFKISGDYFQPTIAAQFFLYPGSFGKFQAAFVEGTLETRGSTISSLLRVDDPQMTGVVGLKSENGLLDVDIKATKARVEYVLPCLDVSLPLAGEGSGQFKVKSQGALLGVFGDFAAPTAAWMGLSLTDVKGRLEFSGGILSFPELRFTWNGGPVQGKARVDFASKDYDIDFGGKSVDLAPLLPELRGILSFDLKGRGALNRDPLAGRLDIRNPGYGNLQAETLSADLSLKIPDERLIVQLKGLIKPGANTVNAALALPLAGGPFVLDLDGSFDNLDVLLPWTGVKGRLNYLAQVRGASSGPQVKGAIEAQGQVLAIPGFPQALNDFAALAFLDNQIVRLRSFRATLGGGKVEGSGEMRLSGPRPGISLDLEGRDMVLVPWERTRALADASLHFRDSSGRFTLEGDVLFKRLSWRREINEPFAISTEAFYQPKRGPSPFANLGLNVRLKADDDAWVENSLGRIRTRFSLALSGTVDAPVVLGDIETVSGTINFQDRNFSVLSGKLSFFNPVTIQPYLDLRAETYIKDYRVTLTLSGLVDRLRPEFTSSPPLPPEDVLALLASGESFKRSYISDLSSQLSSATLLANQLSEQAQKRASKIFSLDRISINPFIMGSTTELVPRLTLGKKISPSLFIYYSTNLTTQREEIVRMEWELSRSFSLVGNRDELGIISLDVKARKRF